MEDSGEISWPSSCCSNEDEIRSVEGPDARRGGPEGTAPEVALRLAWSATQQGNHVLCAVDQRLCLRRREDASV